MYDKACLTKFCFPTFCFPLSAGNVTMTSRHEVAYPFPFGGASSIGTNDITTKRRPTGTTAEDISFPPSLAFYRDEVKLQWH